MYAGEWLQDLLLGVSPVLHIGNQQTRQRTRRKATNDGDIDTIQIRKRGIKFRLGHLRSHQVGRVELNIESLKRPRPGPSCMRRRPRCKPAGCSRPSRPCRRRSRSKAQCKSNFLTEVRAGVQCLHTCRTIVQPGKQKGNLVRPPNDARSVSFSVSDLGKRAHDQTVKIFRCCCVEEVQKKTIHREKQKGNLVRHFDPRKSMSFFRVSYLGEARSLTEYCELCWLKRHVIQQCDRLVHSVPIISARRVLDESEHHQSAKANHQLKPPPCTTNRHPRPST
jgi:hypothetical protein